MVSLSLKVPFEFSLDVEQIRDGGGALLKVRGKRSTGSLEPRALWRTCCREGRTMTRLCRVTVRSGLETKPGGGEGCTRWGKPGRMEMDLEPENA